MSPALVLTDMLLCATWPGEGALAAELHGQILEELFVGFEVGGGSEEVAEGFVFDVAHEFFEEFVGFVLIFDEGVLLALGAEADAVAQGVHVVEVLLPLAVDGDEDDLALEVVEHLGDSWVTLSS